MKSSRLRYARQRELLKYMEAYESAAERLDMEVEDITYLDFSFDSFERKDTIEGVTASISEGELPIALTAKYGNEDESILLWYASTRHPEFTFTATGDEELRSVLEEETGLTFYRQGVRKILDADRALGEVMEGVGSLLSGAEE